MLPNIAEKNKQLKYNVRPMFVKINNLLTTFFKLKNAFKKYYNIFLPRTYI